jgi:maltose O-acetyltransferase
MHLGKGVNLPRSTWIDMAHCFLISIGDHCGFGDSCALLAHDAMPNEYIDSTRIGKIVIHESCHFGMRSIILPGVEIGKRTIIGSGSVVINNIPANSVAAGNPAKVICSIDEYLNKHLETMKSVPNFPYLEYSTQFLTPEKRQIMLTKLANSVGYITGGYTAMINQREGLMLTD